MLDNLLQAHQGDFSTGVPKHRGMEHHVRLLAHFGAKNVKLIPYTPLPTGAVQQKLINDFIGEQNVINVPDIGDLHQTREVFPTEGL